MAHAEQQRFCLRVAARYPELFKNKTVLDVGSQDINGNNRFLFADCAYTGIDLQTGANVDIVAAGHTFKTQKQFDVVISTECLEHDKYWALTLQNIVRNLLRPGGIFVMTCATTGRPEHGTTRTSPADSPFTNEYYMNITENDFRQAVDVEQEFNEFAFETNAAPYDLYFYGIKRLSR